MKYVQLIIVYLTLLVLASSCGNKPLTTSAQANVPRGGDGQLAFTTLTFSGDYDFKQITNLTSSDYAFTISNPGNYPASQVTVKIPPSSPFSVQPNTTCVAGLILQPVTGSCQIVIRYSPQVAGSNSSQFTVSYQNGVQETTVQFTVRGESSAIPVGHLMVTGNGDFGTLAAGSLPVDVPFFLKNDGQGALSNIVYTPPSGNFSIKAATVAINSVLPCAIPTPVITANASCYVSASRTPPRIQKSHLR